MDAKRKIALLFGIYGLYSLIREQDNPIIVSGIIADISDDFENVKDIIMGNQTRGERNNNPGNLRPGNYTWQGQTGVADNFVVFSDAVYGIRAIAKDLMTKYARGLDTVQKIISVYAPPSENLTGAYVASVAQAIGVGANSPLNLGDAHTLFGFVKAIIRHENGRVSYSDELIARGVNMALGA